MLDYSTVQVINSNMGMCPPSKVFIFFIIIATIFLTICAVAVLGGAGLIVGVIFPSVFFFWGQELGVFDNVALIRIETQNIQMVSEVYPSEESRPYLKKEGDKIYYYDAVKSKALGKPSEIKKETKENFEEILFDLKNSQPQEGNNADTTK